MAKNVLNRSLRWVARIVEVGHYDFCPWANRYVYWLKQPIGWFALAATATAAIGILAVPQGWFVCGIIVAVALFGTAWPWLAMRGIEATMQFGRHRCSESDAVPVLVTITNRMPWPSWGLMVVGGFEGATEDSQATVALARVSGWSQTTFEFQFRPARRGIYPFQTPRVLTGFPFGLWSSEQAVSVKDELIVWPRCMEVDTPTANGGERDAVWGPFLDRPGNDGDLLCARNYRDGDSLRRVHWSHTARRDTLIVCDRQSATRRRVAIVIAGSHFSSNRSDDGRLLDCALRAVGSLCRQFLSESCDVRCVLDDESFTVDSHGPPLLRLFDQLAQFSATATGATDVEIPRSLPKETTIHVTTRYGWSKICRTVSADILRSIDAVVLKDSGIPSQETDPLAVAEGSSKRAWLQIDVAQDQHFQLPLPPEREGHHAYCAN